MRHAFILLACAGLIFSSCKKDDNHFSAASLQGAWKMVLVEDLATNTTEVKPAAISSDVIVGFIASTPSGGSFEGHTPSNVFGRDLFSLQPGNRLSISHITMTEVAESSWGRHFIDNISNAGEILLERENLHITTAKKLLSFRKQ